MLRVVFCRVVLATTVMALVCWLAPLDASAQNGNGNGNGGDNGKSKGKKTGQTEIVHGCISAVAIPNPTTAPNVGTVTFQHPKFGGVVVVTATTVIEVCGEVKTLSELKTAVDALSPCDPKYCGIARIDDSMAKNALRIIVCNIPDENSCAPE